MATESSSLLRESSPRLRTSPAAHIVKVEDHRPGRPTTFSLLASGAASRDASVERKPRGYDATAQGGNASAGANGHMHLSVAMPHSHAPHSPQLTPYRYGDGKQGYQVMFPNGPADAAEQAASDAAAARVQRHVGYAISLSLLVNIVLFVTKTYSAIVSGSLAVAAAAVDSFLDLASQLIVFLAERGSKTQHEDYPAGRSRLEPVGIIICASLMGCAALQLILESGEQLFVGYRGDPSDHAQVDFTFFTIALLVSTILAKLALWIYCAAFASHSPTLYTLAADHRNDVLSNGVALVAALIAWRWEEAWSADPIGAILMSVYIVWNWSATASKRHTRIPARSMRTDFIQAARLHPDPARARARARARAHALSVPCSDLSYISGRQSRWSRSTTSWAKPPTRSSWPACAICPPISTRN